jgi:hypothetical protein
MVVKAVIIRPNGDVANHLSRFTDKYILSTDPIFHNPSPCEISLLIELPLLIERINPRDNIPGDIYHKNLPATVLQMRPCSGFAPMDWHRKVGAVMVVREDKKPLSCLQLEVIWKYCWLCLSEANSIVRDHTFKSKISRADFERFWTDYRKRMMEVGREDFEGLVSPYEI